MQPVQKVEKSENFVQKQAVPKTLTLCPCLITWVKHNLQCRRFLCHVTGNYVCMACSGKPPTHLLSIPWLREDLYLLERFVTSDYKTQLEQTLKELTPLDRETCYESILDKIKRYQSADTVGRGYLRTPTSTFITSDFLVSHAKDWIYLKKLKDSRQENQQLGSSGESSTSVLSSSQVNTLTVKTENPLPGPSYSPTPSFLTF